MQRTSTELLWRAFGRNGEAAAGAERDAVGFPLLHPHIGSFATGCPDAEFLGFDVIVGDVPEVVPDLSFELGFPAAAGVARGPCPLPVQGKAFDRLLALAVDARENTKRSTTVQVLLLNIFVIELDDQAID